MRRLAALFALLVLAVPACKGSDSNSPAALGTAADGDGTFAQAEGQRRSGGYAGGEQAKRAPTPGGGAAYEPQTAPPAMDMAEDEAAYAERDYNRDEGPGLGTSYGEQRSSSTSTAPFTRAHARRPSEVLSIWYDDTAGIQNMVDWKGGYYDGTAWTQSGDGLLSVSILDEYGSGLTGMQVGDKRYAAGEVGQRYTIGIQNNDGIRYEVVASVDGLDVIDGEPAGYSKRGYIVEPYSSMTIDGWRTSMSTVAAFRFSEIQDSYADRKGKGRNVGVIGVAFFGEKDYRNRREMRRRDTANPFPGR